MNLPMDVLKEHVGEKRYLHVLRVMELGEEYALRFSLSVEDMKVASFYHDFWKIKPLEKQFDLGRSMGFSITQEDRDYPAVYHGHLAADYVLHLGYRKEIADAIRYHTTGRGEMSKLEMALYLADYLEPKRNFPGVDTLRKLALKDLTLAMTHAIAQNLEYLRGNKQQVHPDSLACYHYYAAQEKGKKILP